MTPDEMIAVIQAHQRGEKIQFRDFSAKEWQDTYIPAWDFGSCEYRVKPEPKPCVIRYACVEMSCGSNHPRLDGDNLRLTFDGETGKLKSAEALP